MDSLKDAYMSGTAHSQGTPSWQPQGTPWRPQGAPLQPGTLLDGRYTIGPLLSRGGFGAVYRGTDTTEGNRPCAIKETYDVSPAARRQALTEAGILFTVKSRHLPQVYDAFEANQRFYLVMQLIEGQTLQELLKARGRPCTEQEVIGWLLPIMQVLQELHSRTPAIIHRDIKPGNIILTPDETAVLVDFGLTKLYEPGSNTQTIVKAVSEGFSPVEQYVGRTNPQSDIYSLAATMYYLLTQKVPPLAINRSLREELIAPRLLNPALSPKIERILLKALAVDPSQRYQSMSEFAQALQEPGFSGHADATIVGTAVQSAAAPTQLATTPASGNTAHGLAPLPPPPPPPQFSRPLPANRGSGPSPFVTPYGASAPYGASVPPGYVLVPQAALEAVRPLPSSFGQGCLWGLLQGILAAIILLALKKDGYFYAATLMGFCFYVLAGFMTTRKGGPLSRGAWAGFWSGITSTILFWITLAIGLIILAAGRIQADTQLAQQLGIPLPPDEITRAFREVAPVILTHQSSQSAGGALGSYLIAGVILAITFGLLGGILGRRRYRQALQKGSRI